MICDKSIFANDHIKWLYKMLGISKSFQLDITLRFKIQEQYYLDLLHCKKMMSESVFVKSFVDKQVIQIPKS